MEENIYDLRYAPKVIVIHAGTNDIRDQVPANEIINHLKRITQHVRQRFRGTKVVVSSIAPREDNEWSQEEVEYINEAVRYELSQEAGFVCNWDIWGREFKAKDGVHLTPKGTSFLAANIKAGICEALDL